MIETIYSNENGDNDRLGKAQASFKMPKNIRQIGRGNSVKKIYIEDYVMSYIKQLTGGEFSGVKLAVLVGQCIKLDSGRNIFISGAVEIKDEEVARELSFTNETWTAIYDDIKKYFVDLEIVGWMIGGPGYLMADDVKIQKTHVDNFAGQDKVLLTYDSLEKEETFYCYENSRLSKQDGYYIYYEKNEEMQTYMIEHKNPESCEMDYEDKVSREIRTVIQNKQAAQEDSKNVTRLMYAAGTLLAVIVLIIGAAMLRNYDQMKNMQDTLNYLSKNMEEVQANFSNGESTDEAKQSDFSEGKEAVVTPKTSNISEDSSKEDDSLDVEVVPGNVEPLAQNTDSSDSQEGKKGEDQETNGDKDLADDSANSETADVQPPDNSPKVEDKAQDVSSKVSYYTVQTGDTLADISFKLYHTYTRVKKIMELNGITDQDLIYVGQKLIVP